MLIIKWLEISVKNRQHSWTRTELDETFVKTFDRNLTIEVNHEIFGKNRATHQELCRF